MEKARYEEIECRTLLNRVRGMGFGWSINPYRGCIHSCHYCFARRYHGFFDLGAGGDFAGVVMVKANAVEVLRRELSKPSWKREKVMLGTATDPYQPVEGKYRITRGILEALARYRTPVGIITKGTLAVRDVDVLSLLARRAGCSVSFSVTTMDRDLWRKLEPGTPPPEKRLLAMKRLSEAGINAGIGIAPIIPGVTDSEESLEEVARAASRHGARFLTTSVLYLKEGVKQHFEGFLEREYPHLLGRYGRMFPGAYAPRAYNRQVRGLVDLFEARHRLPLSDAFPALETPEAPARQLAMVL